MCANLLWVYRGKSEANKEMDENGRVHPACANAANPYHECGVYCLEKIAEGKGRNEKEKKKLGNPSSSLCSISNFIFVKHVIPQNPLIFAFWKMIKAF